MSEKKTYKEFIRELAANRSNLNDLISKIDKITICDFFFLKKIFISLFLLCFFIFLQTNIENFINEFRNNYSDINSSLIKDIVVFIIMIYSVGYVLCRPKGYVFSLNSLYAFAIFIFLYTYYRWICPYEAFNFIHFSFYSSIKYLDISFVIFIALFIRYVIFVFKKDNNSDVNFFTPDSPINKIDKDVFGYRNYATNIANSILKGNYDEAFVIGINGAWGAGKTSLMNLVKTNLELNKEKIILIDFNPWKSTSSELLLQDFFDLVQEAIKPFHSGLARTINNYSKRLIGTENGMVINTIKFFTSQFIIEASLENYVNEINKALKQTDKKLVVFIDDLDRMDTEEIMNIFKLIRNNANFYNTFFVVAYDREYVINLINKDDSVKGATFLSKMFQVDISLPVYEGYRGEIYNKIVEYLTIGQSEDFKTIVISAIERENTFRGIDFNYLLSNIRDVVRFTNALKLNLNNIYKEVVISEFILLELLRYRYPDVYDMMANDINKFTTIDKEYTNNYVYKANEESTKESLTSIKFYDDKGIKFTLELLNKLFFSTKGNFNMYGKSTISIIYPENFYRYFSYGLSDSDLSENDFVDVITNNDKLFLQQKVEEWINKDSDMARKLISKLEKITSYSNRLIYENVVMLIFYIASRPHEQSYFSFSVCLGCNENILINKINNENVINLFYRDDLKKYIAFVRQQFDGAQFPYHFEAGLISKVIKDHGDFRIDENTMLVIAQDYLKKFTSTCKVFDKRVYFLYKQVSDAEISIQLKLSTNINYTVTSDYKPESKKIMITYFKKDIVGFMYHLINVDRSINKYKFSISNYYSNFFTDSEFEIFLQSYNGPEYEDLKQLIFFFHQCKSINFKEFIEFDFSDNVFNKIKELNPVNIVSGSNFY
ncbi:MAG: AAA family ATPase [Sphingobacteriales bacterium]|nr:AAA family ATPase [Sphingobacteriales bacterium]